MTAGNSSLPLTLVWVCLSLFLVVLNGFFVADPMIRSFTWLANQVLRRLGYQSLEEPPLSEEELKMVMRESHEEGVISESEAQIITRAFEFSDKRAGDIMIPAERVDFFSLERSIEQNLEVARHRMKTRFPLCLRGLDTVIGTVHMKDAWPLLMESRSNRALARASRPAVFVEAGVREDQLMKVFKDRRTHLALVIEPRGRITGRAARILGIVTLEDILEELVGEIQDEHGG